jgi:hypothetical protein
MLGAGCLAGCTGDGPENGEAGNFRIKLQQALAFLGGTTGGGRKREGEEWDSGEWIIDELDGREGNGGAS